MLGPIFFLRNWGGMIKRWGEKAAYMGERYKGEKAAKMSRMVTSMRGRWGA